MAVADTLICSLRELCELRFGLYGLAFCSALGPYANLPINEAACIPDEELERAAACAVVSWGVEARLSYTTREIIIAWCMALDPANRVRPSLDTPLPVQWVRQPALTPPASWQSSAFVLLVHRRRQLQLINPHSRDARIWFDEAPHQYWVDGTAVG